MSGHQGTRGLQLCVGGAVDEAEAQSDSGSDSLPSKPATKRVSGTDAAPFLFSFQALLNVVWTLLRPIVIPICFVAIMVLLANDVPVWEAAWLSLTAPLGMLVLFGGWGLITDPIFLRSIGLNNSGAPAGVFYKPNTELDRIMQQCNFEADKYKAPFWCINGDWSTIASEVMEDRPVQYQRMNIPHGEDVPVPVDICVQTTAVAFRESAPVRFLHRATKTTSSLTRDISKRETHCFASRERRRRMGEG